MTKPYRKTSSHGPLPLFLLLQSKTGGKDFQHPVPAPLSRLLRHTGNTWAVFFQPYPREMPCRLKIGFLLSQIVSNVPVDDAYMSYLCMKM